MEERLKEIKARRNATTPGNWEWEKVTLAGEVMLDYWDGLYAMNRLRTAGVGVIWAEDEHSCVKCIERDADYIAHSREDIDFMFEVIEAYKRFILEHVEPLRQLAMEISEKYEPCGYYCDERVGHVDHKLFNSAKYLYQAGDGKQFSIPDELLPELLRRPAAKPGERF